MFEVRIDSVELLTRAAISGLDLADEGFDDILAQAYRELEVSRRRAKMVLANARYEASEICQQARAEAARIVEAACDRAELEAHARRQEIEEKARRQGLEEGLALACAESRGALAAASQLRAGLENAYRQHVLASERQIIETVLAIAERVVALEQEELRDVLGGAIAKVLEDHAAAHDVTLVVNPKDYDAVVGFLAERESVCDRIAGVASTAAVPAGSCKFRSSHFNLDVSLARRFDQIRDHVRQQWELAAPAPADVCLLPETAPAAQPLRGGEGAA